MYPSDIEKIVEGLGLAEGEKKRLQLCEGCGESKPFSVTKLDGNLIWNCFKDSCENRGSLKSLMEVSDLHERFYKSTVVKKEAFTLLDRFIPAYVDNFPQLEEWLKFYNAYEAVKEGRVKLENDPHLGRIVFVCRNMQGNYIDAVGRPMKLNKSKIVFTRKTYKSKWHKYGRSGYGLYVPFYPWESKEKLFCKVTEGVILVEDPLSACACSRIMDSYALLGTSLTDKVRSLIIQNWSFVLIMLDPDATKTALKLKRLLDPHVETHVVELPDDPKYFTKEELHGMLTDWKQNL